MRKYLILIALCLLISQSVLAKDVEVKITPLQKISTSNVCLKSGDNADFIVFDDVYIGSNKVINKGEKVSATITALDDNGFNSQEASVYIENFFVNTVDKKRVKLDGVILKKGKDHSIYTQFIPVLFVYIRGGEVQIKPEKDVFTLYLGEKL